MRTIEIRNDGKVKKYEYNELNQLVRVDEYDGYVIRYSYDGLGNRVQQDFSQTYTLWETETKQVKQRMKKLQDKLAFLDEHDYCIAYFYGEADEYANLEDEYTYYYKTKEVTEEKVSYPSKSTSITYVNDMTQVYSEVVSEKQEGSITNYYYGNKRIQSNERIYVYDGMGNVIQDMSPSGALLESYEYSAYGERNIQYNPFLKNSSYGYRGEAHTYDNKQYLRARYYDVHSENFIQEDTYRGTQDDVASRNRYNYAQNNPYKYSDPSGHDAMSELIAGSSSGGAKREFMMMTYGILFSKVGNESWKVYTGFHGSMYYVNGKGFTGVYSGFVYQDGVKMHAVKPSGNKVTQEYANYTVTEDVISVVYSPAKIKVDAPIIDMSELNAAAQAKVKDTAKALGVPEYVLQQYLQHDTSWLKFNDKQALSDYVIGVCDRYLKNASKSANEQTIVDQTPYGIDDNPEVSYKPGDDLLNFIISLISVEGEVPGDGSSTTYEISLLRLESEAKTETNFTSTIDGYQNEAKTNLGNSGDDKKKIDNDLGVKNSLGINFSTIYLKSEYVNENGGRTKVVVKFLSAEADADLLIGTDGERTGVFAGAKAGLYVVEESWDGSFRLGDFTFGIVLEANSGIGATVEGGAYYEDGSIYASGEIGGTLGAGGKMKVYVIYTEPPKRTQEEWEQLILEIEAATVKIEEVWNPADYSNKYPYLYDNPN